MGGRRRYGARGRRGAPDAELGCLFHKKEGGLRGQVAGSLKINVLSQGKLRQGRQREGLCLLPDHTLPRQPFSHFSGHWGQVFQNSRKSKEQAEISIFLCYFGSHGIAIGEQYQSYTVLQRPLIRASYSSPYTYWSLAESPFWLT